MANSNSNSRPHVAQTMLAVAARDEPFPVRRVYCVGRNYAAHAREMGADPDREPPFFFLKPADAVVPAEGAIAYPPLTEDLHHEVELVVAIGDGGADIPAEKALTHVWGYAVGVDLTRRDLQAAAKAAGRPWEWGKSFDAAAPCGPLHPVSAVGHPARGRIWLDVNGETRQDGDLDALIWGVADVIALCSRASRLMPGDLIMTGTPAGVSAVDVGDRIVAGVEGLGEIAFEIGAPAHV